MILNLFIQIVIVTYPFLVYLFYLICSKNDNPTQSRLVFNLAIWSSLYVSLRFNPASLPIIIFNIPIIIAYLKKETLLGIFISFIVILIHFYDGGNDLFVIVEYVSYLFIYLIFIKMKLKEIHFIFIILFIKGIMIALELYYMNFSKFDHIYLILEILGIILLYYIVTYMILFFYHKSKELSNIYLSLKDIQKEKIVRDSLFKITHEVKNPLAVCKGYFDMLDYNNFEQIKKYLPIIEGEINRTLTILTDFMDFTKIKIEKDLIDINLLLEDVIGTLVNFSKARNVELINSIKDEEIYLQADYDRLKQVIINLIKNGIEASDKDYNYVKISSVVKKDFVEVRIIDNGSGMDEYTLKRYDKGFYTTKKDGTGLGVSLSKEIISSHDGEINYKTKYKEWTEVKIILPLS